MIKRVIKECMISFIENSRKCKLNCLGLKQISSCLEMRLRAGIDCNGHEESLPREREASWLWSDADGRDSDIYRG